MTEVDNVGNARGPTICSINYKHTEILDIPCDSRGQPSQWIELAGRAASFLAENYSIAIALGYDVNEKVSPESVGLLLLSPNEKHFYQAWKREDDKPKMDWGNAIDDDDSTPAKLRRWEHFVPVLNKIYEKNLKPEEARQFGKKHQQYMPLLTSVKKMEEAKRSGRAIDTSDRNRMLFIELMACRRLMSLIGQQRASSSSEMKSTLEIRKKREQELLKRLKNLESKPVLDANEATFTFDDRKQAYNKLVETRVESLKTLSSVKRQNKEFRALEAQLKHRIDEIQSRLEQEARSCTGSTVHSGVSLPLE